MLFLEHFGLAVDVRAIGTEDDEGPGETRSYWAYIYPKDNRIYGCDFKVELPVTDEPTVGNLLCALSSTAASYTWLVKLLTPKTLADLEWRGEKFDQWCHAKKLPNAQWTFQEFTLGLYKTLKLWRFFDSVNEYIFDSFIWIRYAKEKTKEA